MAHSERTTRLARSIHKLCDKIRAEEFLTPGQIRFYNRVEGFKQSRDQCVADAQSLLDVLQARDIGSSAVGSVQDTVQAIKEHVVDVTEQIDLALDRHRSSSRAERDQGQVHVTAATTRDVPQNHHPAPLRSASAQPKPQDLFYPPIDNSNTQFNPNLAHLMGIATDISDTGEPQETDEAGSAAAEIGHGSTAADQISRRYAHPFATALGRLPGLYPAWILEPPTPRPPASMESCPFTYVDSQESLAEMAEELSSVREFAVDLEHSDRSFLGFTCLMQISTRGHDYVIDALSLRSHLGPALAAPFADTQVLKVMHGADRDIEWLQKDFGLFVVNMFDTGRAAKLVGLPCGLGKLLHHVCQVSTDKSLQMADWRKRPLTNAMMRYARTDTHYLLYIADVLRLKLMEAEERSIRSVQLPVPGPEGLLGQCLERSRQMTLKLYEKPLLTPTSYISFYQRCNARLTLKQLSALAALYSWRDATCRSLDESPGHFLPKRLLLVLSQRMPEDTGGVLRVAGRHKILCQYAKEVAEVISEGLKNPVAPEVPAMAERAERGVEQGGDEAGSASSAGDVASLHAEDESERASEDGSEPATAEQDMHGRQDGSAAAPQQDAEPGSASDGSDMLGVAAEPPTAAKAGSTAGGGKAKQRSSSQRNDVADEALAGSGVEAVSFASLPTRKVMFPSAGASRSGPAGISLAGGACAGEARQLPGSGRPELEPSQAQATMAAMFAEPIKRRPITVRKASAAVSSLGGMFAGTSGAAVTVAPSHTQAEATASGGPGGPHADAWGPGSRDKAAEVTAAAAALRAEAQGLPAAEGSAGDAAVEADDGEEEPLSVRERYGRKRKSGGSLLGDVTTVPLSQRRGKAVMLRLRNQSDNNVDAGTKRGLAGSAGDEDVQMFDYEAMLDGSDRLPSRRGRGRSGRGDRGRGRGGRDSGRHGHQGRRQLRGDEHKSSKRAGIFEGRRGAAWNPYAIEAAETMGKRSGGSAPKSANKSGNFRG